MNRIFFIIFGLMIFQTSPVKAQDDVFLFAYFKNNGQDGLHLAYSNDGYSFTALRQDSSFLKPLLSKDKLMRDPCIIRGADQKFHMVWTVSWNEKGIGYASSPDLIHWSEQLYIPVMEKEMNARNCWAPEIIYDKKKKQYMIYWATTITGKYAADTAIEKGYNHRIYYVTTKDFKVFSQTKLLYDQGFNVIDATIISDGDQYVMFLKDETLKPVQKNIRMATSKNLTKDFSQPSPPITGNYWAEGPTTIKINDQWIVYFDKYREHQYGAVTSMDLKTWTDISDKISMPKGMRHGTVLKITKDELEKLKHEF
ncbi:MAG: family 43 glycosylhydrolase [Ferruginibacter sp.]